MYTILLVDGGPGVQKSVGDMLKRSGYDVLRAEDGRFTLAALQSPGTVDLVISGHRMPGLDGLALVRRIREAAPRLPVVIMTANGDCKPIFRHRSRRYPIYPNALRAARAAADRPGRRFRGVVQEDPRNGAGRTTVSAHDIDLFTLQGTRQGAVMWYNTERPSSGNASSAEPLWAERSGGEKDKVPPGKLEANAPAACFPKATARNR